MRGARGKLPPLPPPPPLLSAGLREPDDVTNSWQIVSNNLVATTKIYGNIIECDVLTLWVFISDILAIWQN